MKKLKILKVIASSLVVISSLALNQTGISAKTKYNEISSMKNVSYQFKTSTDKTEIGDINTLVYVDHDGNLYSTGNISLLESIDKSEVETLYYIDKNGGIATIYGVGEIYYADEKGIKIDIGAESDSKNANATIPNIKSTINNEENSNANKIETGWINDNGKLKYVYSSGQECRGWLKQDNYWYYFYASNGYMAKNEKVNIGGKIYSFDSSGRLEEGTNRTDNNKKTGWIRDGYTDERGESSDDWRYVDSDGKNHIGWLQDNGEWYYFEKCGHMAKNTIQKIDGKIYSFDSSGHIKKSLTETIWYTENTTNRTGPLDGSDMLFPTTTLNIVMDNNGVCTLTDEYYSEKGLSTNWVLSRRQGHIDGDCNVHWILFDTNGDQVFGWYSEPMYTKAADSRGYIENHRWTYYDEQTGVQVRSASRVIDGKTYSFDSQGYLM